MGAWRGATLVSTCGLLITVVSLAAEHGLGRLPGSRADSVAAVPSRSFALRHLGSSWIRDRTHVSCTDRWTFITEPPGRPGLAFRNV